MPRRGDPLPLARKVLAECGYLDTFRLTPRLDLPALLAELGLTWHRRDLAGLSGALVEVDGRYYCVTDSRLGWARQRFTAAHELKHFGHMAPVLCCRRNADRGVERAANIFARELLMPARPCISSGSAASMPRKRLRGCSGSAARRWSYGWRSLTWGQSGCGGGRAATEAK